MTTPTMFSKQVGKYYLGRTLGEGTYAKVKYGQHIETGEAIAIKILDKERLVQDEMVEQIKREITILKHLKHPNVVDLKEVMASEEKIYMVMELVSGGELFDKIVAEGPMSEIQARRVLHELMSALDCAHKQGIFHRDLKPENVLVTTEGTVKLSDFGLGALPASINSENGKLMTTCGTPNYVAPEVLAKSGYEGAPADIWSLGVVLYVIMAGCLPFDEPSLPALFDHISKAKYETPPWFSSEVCALLKKMMCVDPAKRITLQELAKDPWVRAGGYHPAAGVMTDIAQQEAEDIFSANGVTPMDVTPSQSKMAQAQALTGFSRLNAFVLISAAIDLSGIFEQRKDVVTRHTRFTSRATRDVILKSLSQAAGAMGGSGEIYLSESNNEKKLRMTFYTPKGAVITTVEIFEVISGTQMVEMVRNQGDHIEFYRLYHELVERGAEAATRMTDDPAFEPLVAQGAVSRTNVMLSQKRM